MVWHWYGEWFLLYDISDGGGMVWYVGKWRPLIFSTINPIRSHIHFRLSANRHTADRHRPQTRQCMVWYEPCTSVGPCGRKRAGMIREGRCRRQTQQHNKQGIAFITNRRSDSDLECIPCSVFAPSREQRLGLSCDIFCQDACPRWNLTATVVTLRADHRQ